MPLNEAPPPANAPGWCPDLSGRTGPLYRSIVEALERDIAQHVLESGTQLPTHRALARDLNVTLSTVTRAYREARERGLIEGTTGRGTFVCQQTTAPPNRSSPPLGEPRTIDLMVNQPAIDPAGGALPEALRALADHGDLGALLGYHNSAGHEHHRAAGARWVSQAGVSATASNVIVCSGAQQALFAAAAAVLSPGDLLVTERLNYAGVRRIADLLSVRLKGLPIDAEGLDPDAFAAVCRRETVRALVVTPNFHNPTTATLGLERRKAIVAIARANGVHIIEDDISGPLAGGTLPPLYSLADRDAVYVSGTAKSIYPGLRIGYLVAPEAKLQRYVEPVHSTSWGATQMMAEIVSRWIYDGTAQRYVSAHRKTTVDRSRLARKILGDRLKTRPGSYHAWLELPDGWQSDEFAVLARLDGVAVAPASMFTLEGASPPAIRLSLGSVGTAEELRTGLDRLADLIVRRPTAALV